MAARDLDSIDDGARSAPAPTPFRADGGYSLAGALMLTGLLGLSGLLLGVVASFVSQWFYLIVLFPLAIGLGVGWAGVFGIRRFQIRTPVMCGLAGFCGGCLAMLAMHHTDFRREMALRAEYTTPREIEVASRIEAIKSDPAADPEDLSLARELEAEPMYLRLLQIRTFPDYLDYNAHRGVELRRTGRGKGLNLGYTGSYVYWGVEVLIVAVVAFGTMKSAATEPFCTNCHSWKVEQEFSGVGGSPQELAAALSTGDLAGVQRHLASEGQSSVVNLWVCLACEDDAPFEAGVKEITTNGKGEVTKKPHCLVTYPGEALTELREIVFRYAAAADFDGSDESAIRPSPIPNPRPDGV